MRVDTNFKGSELSGPSVYILFYPVIWNRIMRNMSITIYHYIPITTNADVATATTAAVCYSYSWLYVNIIY